MKLTDADQKRAEFFLRGLVERVKQLGLPPGGVLQSVFGDVAYIKFLKGQVKSARAEVEALRLAKIRAWRLGGRKYLVGGSMVILTEAQDIVLQALIELGGKAALDELRRRSGTDGCNKVLRRILKAHPEFQPYITLPKQRAHGGYSTSILEQAPQK